MVRIVAFLKDLLVLYQRLRLFVGRDIWRTDLAAASRLGAIGIYPLRVILIVVRGFWFEHQGLLRASALTYSTLLSLVPILAFALAFLKGLGVHNLLEPFLIDRGVIGSEETVRMLLSYANNIEVRTLGGLGLATLVFTTVLGVGNIERAFNEIWGCAPSGPSCVKSPIMPVSWCSDPWPCCWPPASMHACISPRMSRRGSVCGSLAKL